MTDPGRPQSSNHHKGGFTAPNTVVLTSRALGRLYRPLLTWVLAEPDQVQPHERWMLAHFGQQLRQREGLP